MLQRSWVVPVALGATGGAIVLAGAPIAAAGAVAGGVVAWLAGALVRGRTAAPSDAARSVEAERRMLAAVVETAPVGMLVEGPNGTIDLVNRMGLAHIDAGSPEEWLGRPMRELIAEFVPRLDDAESRGSRFRRASLGGADIEDLELVLTEPPRVLRLFVSRVESREGEALGRVWLTRDVTDERLLEDQLRHSQKLETIGTLSGGIAHDFNNQLAVILGNARFVQQTLGREEQPDPDVVESLDDLERAAEHCAGLTRSLLAFARRAPVSIGDLDTHEVIGELGELLRPLMPGGIEVQTEVAHDVAHIAADANQIQQVLLNLSINACDAMKESGRLRIAARTRRVEAEESSGVVGARPGEFVEIEVSDSGRGIEPEGLHRIFEPFYTTKPVGEGTGLGLAIVHGVVSAHEGWIEVESRVGSGTTFRVLLPVADHTAEAR